MTWSYETRYVPELVQVDERTWVRSELIIYIQTYAGTLKRDANGKSLEGSYIHFQNNTSIFVQDKTAEELMDILYPQDDETES